MDWLGFVLFLLGIGIILAVVVYDRWTSRERSVADRLWSSLFAEMRRSGARKRP